MQPKNNVQIVLNILFVGVSTIFHEFLVEGHPIPQAGPKVFPTCCNDLATVYRLLKEESSVFDLRRFSDVER